MLSTYQRRLKNKKRQFDENKNPTEKSPEANTKSQEGELSEKEDGERSEKSLSPITNNKNLATKIKTKKNRNKNKNKRIDQKYLTRKPTLLQQVTLHFALVLNIRLNFIRL